MSISTRFYNFTNIENYLNKMHKTHHLLSLSDNGIFQASNNENEIERFKQIRQLLDNKLFFNFVNAFSDKINQPLTLDSLPSDLFNFEYYYETNLPGPAEPGWCVKITENYEQELDRKITKLRSYAEAGQMIDLVNKINNIENYKRHINTHFELELAIPGNQYFKPETHKTVITKNLTEIHNYLKPIDNVEQLALTTVHEFKDITNEIVSRNYKIDTVTNTAKPDNSFTLKQRLEEGKIDFDKELNQLTQTTQDKFKKFGTEQRLNNYWIDKAIEKALQALKQNLIDSIQTGHDIFENYDQYKQQVNTDFANYFKKAYITNQQKINDTLATLL